MKFKILLLTIIVASANTAEPKRDPLECKKWVRVKYTKNGKKFFVDTPKNLFRKGSLCSKPFRVKTRINRDRG